MPSNDTPRMSTEEFNAAMALEITRRASCMELLSPEYMRAKIDACTAHAVAEAEARRWTKASEPPKEDCKVLVTFKSEDGTYKIGFCEYFNGSFRSLIGPTFNGILAWMPLPAPFDPARETNPVKGAAE